MEREETDNVKSSTWDEEWWKERKPSSWWYSRVPIRKKKTVKI